MHNIELHILYYCRSVSGSTHPPSNTTKWDLPWCDAIGCRHDPPKSSTMILYNYMLAKTICALTYYLSSTHSGWCVE